MSLNLRKPIIGSPSISTPANSIFPGIDLKDRILIVDDLPDVRKFFVDCLSDNYECVEAGTVMEAFSCLSEQEFAVVITDMLMPGLSGVELLRKVIENHPYTAVIVVTGVDNPQRALDAIRLGAFDYLIKPVDLEVLELTIERAIEHRTLLLNARQYKLDLEVRNNELARGKTELQRLQSQIVHNEKMASLGQLAAGIAHEVNNPVGFIYGNMALLSQITEDLKKLLDLYDKAELLPMEIKDEVENLKAQMDYEATIEDLSSIVQDCREGAERIRDVVQNLRTFSRLDEAEFKKTDINEGIDSTVRLLSRYYSVDNITLVRDYGELPQVDAYSGQLNQVWMNLLVNAAQAVTPKGGEVRITTRSYRDSIIVKISDTGCGIPPDKLNKIFEPFYTTKPVGEGTGLGLSISFSIIERHNGTIKVESQVDEGTTFIITLPVNIKPSPESENQTN